MADLEGTVDFSDGELTGELGATAVGGGDKPFIIPITSHREGSGPLIYTTTVMFADIVDAYKTGKRILIRSAGFGGEADVEIVSATITEISMNSTGGSITTSIDKIAMIEELMPQRNMSTLDRSFSANIYEFSYGVNGATVTRNPMVVPTYDALSHVGMIIHSTTLDTEAKVIAAYGGTRWTQIIGRFLLGASTVHPAGSTGGSEDAVLVNHRHLAASVTGNTNQVDIPGTVSGQAGLEKTTVKYTSGSVSVKPVTDVHLITDTSQHVHQVNGMAQPTDVDTNSAGALVVSNAEGANMPPYKTVYIWERVE